MIAFLPAVSYDLDLPAVATIFLVDTSCFDVVCPETLPHMYSPTNRTGDAHRLIVTFSCGVETSLIASMCFMGDEAQCTNRGANDDDRPIVL